VPSPLEIPQRELDQSKSRLALVDMRETTETHPGLDEEELVRRAQEGSAEAFEWLYQRHVRRVYALCLRMVSDPIRAEELTQDVFVRIWKAIGSFRSESAFTTWMHRLAVNVVVSDLRSEKRRDGRVMHTDTLEDFQREVKEAMPETRIDLERAIAALPDGAKEMMVLHDIEGYRYREIAEMLGVAEGTVKSQISRARRLIREALN
jgi:RNA polymerase sigma-70 factor (ECF subfamily)